MTIDPSLDFWNWRANWSVLSALAVAIPAAWWAREQTTVSRMLAKVEIERRLEEVTPDFRITFEHLASDELSIVVRNRRQRIVTCEVGWFAIPIEAVANRDSVDGHNGPPFYRNTTVIDIASEGDWSDKTKPPGVVFNTMVPEYLRHHFSFEWRVVTTTKTWITAFPPPMEEQRIHAKALGAGDDWRLQWMHTYNPFDHEPIDIADDGGPILMPPAGLPSRESILWFVPAEFLKEGRKPTRP